MNGMLNTALLALTFLLLFASAEWLHHKQRFKAEVTRKYVHIMTGLLTMSFPLVLNDQWHVLFLCCSFLIILLVSMRWGLLRSINGVDRETLGGLLYPIVVFGCYLAYQHFAQFVFYYLPILILAICDPMAALVGSRWPRGRYTVLGHTKTLSGSIAFFITAIALSSLFFLGAEEARPLEGLVLALVVATVTTVAEGVSHKGYDNLTVPLGAMLVLVLGNASFAFF
jgi:phytol kinase